MGAIGLTGYSNRRAGKGLLGYAPKQRGMLGGLAQHPDYEGFGRNQTGLSAPELAMQHVPPSPEGNGLPTLSPVPGMTPGQAIKTYGGLPHPSNFTPRGQMLQRGIDQIGRNIAAGEERSRQRLQPQLDLLERNNQQRAIGLRSPDFQQRMDHQFAGAMGGGLIAQNDIELTPSQKGLLRYQAAARAGRLRPGLGGLADYQQEHFGQVQPYPLNPESGGPMTVGGPTHEMNDKGEFVPVNTGLPKYTAGTSFESQTTGKPRINVAYDRENNRMGLIREGAVPGQQPTMLQGTQDYMDRQKEAAAESKSRRLLGLAELGLVNKNLPAAQFARSVMQAKLQAGNAALTQKQQETAMHHEYRKKILDFVHDARIELMKRRLENGAGAMGVSDAEWARKMEFLEQMENQAKARGLPKPGLKKRSPDPGTFSPRIDAVEPPDMIGAANWGG